MNADERRCGLELRVENGEGNHAFREAGLESKQGKDVESGVRDIVLYVLCNEGRWQRAKAHI
jgi:hypothetical protein